MPETIYVIAPAGHPNFGDVFIVSAWLRELYRRRPKARVILDCHTPGVASILHANLHPNLTVTDTLWSVALERSTPEEVVEAFSNTYSIPRLTTGMNLAKTADVVHVVGGGWFNDSWPHHIKVLAGATCLGAQLKVMTGQGFIPGTETKEELAPWLAKFDQVLVRDEPSNALHHNTSVVDRGVDDAWLAAADHDARHGLGWGNPDARSRDFVIAAQSDFLAIEPDELARRIVEQLRYLGATGDNLVFLECIPEDDYRVLDALVAEDPELLAGVKVVAFDELWAFGLPTREGQTWISTRFHQHLIAAARGISGIAVSAHEGTYYSVKHGSVGSSWTITDLHEPVDPGAAITNQQLDANALAAFEAAENIYPLSRSQQLTQNLKAIGRRAKARLKR